MAGKYQTIRGKKLSFLIDKKALLLLAVLFVLFLIVVIGSIELGDVLINPLDALKAIFGSADGMQNIVVRSFRLPRILIAALAGAALAVSGTILQGLVRNPLASPDIIGVTAGASLTTVGFLALFSTGDTSMDVSIQWLPVASFIGAIAVSGFVYVLSQKNFSPVRLVLIGIGITAGVKALTDMMMLLGPVYLASQSNIWLTGSVNGADWSQVVFLLIWFLVFFVLALGLSRRLNAQELGEKVAVGIGGHPKVDRVLLLVVSASLAAGAVAFAGGIGFVGLMAPHIARRLARAGHGTLIPVSALIGAMIVMLSDLVGRLLFSPLEIPAGVFTSAIGAPYFIYLLYKTRKRR
ncbi:FecCD family ABC transporter permease [Camelliibacillus cellulosilyticus]|uniref:FecCD family ABC transporter permease n=1 Tax=Camelliibacillus cellulosilyticus TaxID=2174486 RepID=A0ABV9GMT5_9BACL